MIRLDDQNIAVCRPEHIWQKFAELPQWPAWLPMIARAEWKSGEPWAIGSRFAMSFKSPPITVECEVFESAPPKQIAWRGNLMGITAEHFFRFEPQPDGSTLMKQWEQFTGAATMFLSSGRQQQISAIHAEWFAAL